MFLFIRSSDMQEIDNLSDYLLISESQTYFQSNGRCVMCVIPNSYQCDFHLEEKKHEKRNQTKTEGEIHLFLLKALFICKHYPCQFIKLFMQIRQRSKHTKPVLNAIIYTAEFLFSLEKYHGPNMKAVAEGEQLCCFIRYFIFDTLEDSITSIFIPQEKKKKKSLV